MVTTPKQKHILSKKKVGVCVVCCGICITCILLINEMPDLFQDIITPADDLFTEMTDRETVLFGNMVLTISILIGLATLCTLSKLGRI